MLRKSLFVIEIYKLRVFGMNVIHIIIRGNKGFVLYELHFPLSQVLYVISHDNLYLVSLIVLDYIGAMQKVCHSPRGVGGRPKT